MRDIPALDDIEHRFANIEISIEKLKQEQALHVKALDEHNNRLTKLETGVPIPPPDPEPDPNPTPSNRWGINLGERQYSDKPWRPDKALLPDGTLNPEYVRLLKPVAHTIRFMDKNEINNLISPPAWSYWVKDLDWQIELCNRCSSNFWLNFFVDSTITFIGDTILYIRNRLNHNLKIIVAWANEPWIGDSTDVGRWMIAQSEEQLGGDKFFDLWASRCRRTFEAAKNADPSCITVLETQTASTWVTEKLHSRIPNYDALGITCYYGPGLGSTAPSSLTMNELFDFAHNKLYAKEIPRIQDQGAFAEANNKLLVSYEGGNHFAIPEYQHAGRESLVKTLIEANYDSRILTMYDDIIEAYIDAGGSDYRCHFNFLDTNDKYGCWGLGETLDTLETSTKYHHATGQL